MAYQMARMPMTLSLKVTFVVTNAKTRHVLPLHPRTSMLALLATLFSLPPISFSHLELLKPNYYQWLFYEPIGY